MVQVASQFESSIYVETEDKRVNAKSIMGMMTLGLTSGEQVTVSASGSVSYTHLQVPEEQPDRNYTGNHRAHDFVQCVDAKQLVSKLDDGTDHIQRFYKDAG